MISAQVAQGRATEQLAENRLVVERQRIATELVSAWSLARAHYSDEKRLNALLSDVHRAAVVSVDRYRHGGLGILETSDSINLWVQTLLNERGAYYSYLADLARLDRLQGSRTYEKFF